MICTTVIGFDPLYFFLKSCWIGVASFYIFLWLLRPSLSRDFETCVYLAYGDWTRIEGGWWSRYTNEYFFFVICYYIFLFIDFRKYKIAQVADKKSCSCNIWWWLLEIICFQSFFPRKLNKEHIATRVNHYPWWRYRVAFKGKMRLSSRWQISKDIFSPHKIPWLAIKKRCEWSWHNFLLRLLCSFHIN